MFVSLCFPYVDGEERRVKRKETRWKIQRIGAEKRGNWRERESRRSQNCQRRHPRPRRQRRQIGLFRWVGTKEGYNL